MDKLQLMNIFVNVAETQSFTAAARQLQLSPPAVTRAVTALENQLKVKLLIRTTRHVRITDAGRDYLARVKPIIHAVSEADDIAMGINAEPRGQLNITAPVLFGKMFVLPLVTEFLQRYPATQISALLLDRALNMLEENIDVAIRIGELADSSMNAVRVGQVRHVICASPHYLAQHATPQVLNELAGHTLISASNSGNAWKFNTATLQVQPRLAVTTHDAAIDAAVHGLGITRVLSYQITALLATGALTTLLDTEQPAAMPIHVLHSEGRHTSAKVRAFVDMMVAQLQADTALH